PARRRSRPPCRRASCAWSGSASGAGDSDLRLEHDLSFELVVPMAYGEALAFVRDVRRSFAEADFLLDLGFETGPPPAVRAELPVAAAFLGQRSLPFRSLAEWRPRGGALVGQPMEVGGLGWAQVDGEAEVEALGEASSS